MSDKWTFTSIESDVPLPPEAAERRDDILAKWIARIWIEECRKEQEALDKASGA